LANSFAAWGKGETGDQAKRGDVMELKDGSHVGRFTGKTRMGPNGVEYEMYAGNAGNADHAHGQFGSVKESWYSGSEINFRGMSSSNVNKDNNGLIPLNKGESPLSSSQIGDIVLNPLSSSQIGDMVLNPLPSAPDVGKEAAENLAQKNYDKLA